MVPSTWLKYSGMKRMALDARNSKSSISPEGRIMSKPVSKHLVVCIENDDFAVSLEKRKIYVSFRDPAAEQHGLI